MLVRELYKILNKTTSPSIGIMFIETENSVVAYISSSYDSGDMTIDTYIGDDKTRFILNGDTNIEIDFEGGFDFNYNGKKANLTLMRSRFRDIGECE